MKPVSGAKKLGDHCSICSPVLPSPFNGQTSQACQLTLVVWLVSTNIANHYGAKAPLIFFFSHPQPGSEVQWGHPGNHVSLKK